MAALSRFTRPNAPVVPRPRPFGRPPRPPARCRLSSCAGRVAQWESARFTRERSLVRNQPRPFDKVPLSGQVFDCSRETGRSIPRSEIGFLPVCAQTSRPRGADRVQPGRVGGDAAPPIVLPEQPAKRTSAPASIQDGELAKRSGHIQRAPSTARKTTSLGEHPTVLGLRRGRYPTFCTVGEEAGTFAADGGARRGGRARDPLQAAGAALTASRVGGGLDGPAGAVPALGQGHRERMSSSEYPTAVHAVADVHETPSR